MIEFSHPFERRSAFERAVVEQRDGGASFYRSLGMPEAMITRVVERRTRKTVKTVSAPIVSAPPAVADFSQLI